MFVFDILRSEFGNDIEITNTMRLDLENFFIAERESIDFWLEGNPLDILDLRFAIFLNNPDCVTNISIKSTKLE